MVGRGLLGSRLPMRTPLTLALLAALALVAPAVADGTATYQGGYSIDVAGTPLNVRVNHGSPTASFVAPAETSTLSITVVDDLTEHVAFDVCLNVGQFQSICSKADPSDVITTGHIDAATLSVSLPAGAKVVVSVYDAYANTDGDVAVATTGTITASFS